jgi:hypothetical protein
VGGLVIGVGMQVDERRGNTADLQAQAHEQDEAQTYHVELSVAHYGRQGKRSLQWTAALQ